MTSTSNGEDPASVSERVRRALLSKNRKYSDITAFWLVLDSADPHGPNNIGISAYSRIQAFDIVDACAERLLAILPRRESMSIEVVEQFDVRQLDPDRVMPFIGDSTKMGIGWPLGLT